MIKSCDIDADGYHLSASGDRWLDCLDRVLMDLKDFRFFSLSLSCFVRLFENEILAGSVNPYWVSPGPLNILKC